MKGEHVFLQRGGFFNKDSFLFLTENGTGFVLEERGFQTDFQKFSTVRSEVHGILFQGDM